MKKILSSFLVVVCACAFVFAGCAKKQGVIQVPTFTSGNVNSYLKDYAAYCNSAEELYKDPQQFSQIPKKMEEFGKRQAVVVKELNGEAEINAFNKCIQDIREHLEKVRLNVLKSGGGK